MGYTHYWGFKKKPVEIENGEIKFANASRKFKEGLEKLPKEIELSGGDGEGNPIITDTEIWFNGKGEKSHETCYISVERGESDFCKTCKKPYDVAVCLILLCMKEEFGDDFEFNTDGDFTEEGWVNAKEIFSNL